MAPSADSPGEGQTDAGPQVALVHERLTELGGSEKVVDVLARSFSVTEVFVPVRDAQPMGLALDHAPVHTSSLQRLYRNDGRYAHLLPLLPLSFRQFDPGAAEAVVVSHHAFANRVVTSVRDRPVISYVHSPARWMWDERFAAAEVSREPARRLLSAFSRTQRQWDRRAAKKVTTLLANSTEVQNRIRQWWESDAHVVPPPIDCHFFSPDFDVAREEFFLYAGRLTGYKRPDVAILAAQRAGVKLVIAGTGRELARCRTLAGSETTFVGSVDDVGLRDLFRRCKALVFTGLEDFGMIPVEAQACGAPVLGLGQGGIRDTVVDGVTGAWVGTDADFHDTETLIDQFGDAMQSFDSSRYAAATAVAHAGLFDTAHFIARMRQEVAHALIR